MPHIPFSRAPQFSVPNVTFTGLASPQRGSTDNSVWHVAIAPNSPGLPHQLTREEIIVAISGQAKAEIGGKLYTLEAGDAIVVPPGQDFTLSNDSKTAFTAIAVLPVGGQAVIAGEQPFTPPWAA